MDRASLHRLAIAFAPALVIWPLWLYTMFMNDAWSEVFTPYWPMSVAMILGSFVAGSTPLGGGVVAYPIAQLVLYWPTPDSRDASILVQSVGMNAAGFLLITTKRDLLDWTFILVFTVVGGLGVLLGLAVASPATVSPYEWRENTLPPGLANIIFGAVVFAFAIAYYYSAEVLQPSASSSSQGAKASIGTIRRWILWLLMPIFAIIGGFLSANVGSGSDMALYIYGTFVHNALSPPTEHLSETTLTASSVVVMGLISLLASLCRALNGGFTRKIILCWGADAFIVVLGAPIGSPSSRQRRQSSSVGSST